MASSDDIANAMLRIEAAGTGYSQPRRWSFVQNKDARPLVLVNNRAADCSSATAAAVVMAGYNVSLATVGGTDIWTGNMEKKFTDAGASAFAFSLGALRRGDIVWRSEHVEVVTSVNPLQITGARSDEYGDISGPTDGDQTDREFATSAFHGTWGRIFRFPTTTKPIGDFLMALTDHDQSVLFNRIRDIKTLLTGNTGRDLLQEILTNQSRIETHLTTIENEGKKMMKVCYYKEGNTVVYMLFNEVSGFSDKFSKGEGLGPMPNTYINAITKNWNTGVWTEVTKGHFGGIQMHLENVRQRA